MKRQLLATAVLCLAACGAPPPSTTRVEGSVGGIDFPRAFAIYGKDSSLGPFDRGRVFVLISGTSAACSQLADTGWFTRSGVAAPGAGFAGPRVPSLYLETSDPAFSWNTRPTVGGGMTASLDSNGALTAATVGSMSLDRFDDPDSTGATAAGTFNVGFQRGAFAGTFAATPCRALRHDCSTSGAGLGLPALLAIAVASLRRRSRRALA